MVSVGHGAKPRREHADAAGHALSIDPWQTLAQVGAQLIAALTAASQPAAPAHPWVELDPDTGARHLKVPLPSPETGRRLAEALVALADAFRGKLP